MNPNASEHNHDMMSPEEMVKAWPAEVNEMIIQLARQRLQTHEIREAVKQQFPDISWNERRFYNRLTEERKRIRQRGVVERSQRLLLLSARLCSVVASHEEWAFAVESDLQRMFENFCQLARLTPENIHTLVDLQAGMIQMDTDRLVSNTHRLSISGVHSDPDEEIMASPAKKRRSFATRNGNDMTVVHKNGGTGVPENQKGIQMVHVPSYTIQVRSSINRSCSESSTASMRRVYTESPFLDNQQQQQQQIQQQQAFGSSSSFFSLASPTSSASSSSSMPFQHRHPMAHAPQQQQTRVTSPQHSIHSPTEFMMSQSYQTPQPQQPSQRQHEDNYAMSVSTTTATVAPTSASVPNSTANLNYNIQTTFSPYTIPTSAFTTPPEQLPFAFDSVMGDRLTSNSNSNNDQFFSQVKEDPTQVEQQQQTMLRQQHEYAQRMHRNFSQQQQQQQQQQSGGYSLPMIRANEDTPEETHWSQ